MGDEEEPPDELDEEDELVLELLLEAELTLVKSPEDEDEEDDSLEELDVSELELLLDDGSPKITSVGCEVNLQTTSPSGNGAVKR